MIQREFLWNSGLNSRGISWICWSDVSKSREADCLGIECLKAFNEYLICKWKRCFLVDKDAIWRLLLEFRYDSLIDCVIRDISSTAISKSSLWWREIITNSLEVLDEDWFRNDISCVLGNDGHINCWHTK